MLYNTINNIDNFIIYHNILSIYKYPRARISFPTLSSKALPSYPDSPFPTIDFLIMGSLSLNQLPQRSQSTSFGNEDFLKLKPVHWRPGSELTVKCFFPLILSVPHDSNDHLGPPSLEWCCQLASFQAGIL